ncbi:hypothetical protein [Desulforamulus aquiferis]|uniref:Uncharacterized protein n=1 Tax=Desulforamulus aquiferis TaxID=1397668 RepID=A0AAW7ZEJ5_9FIRM|nr:hypothetical protein [Desulforamulus aquiferis]MDO7787708.1 hypothetical protein [Desulforamulus aquiferis]RYD03731.1 hypothetical protein N752_18455 [Desulforamulus aquiferis]
MTKRIKGIIVNKRSRIANNNNLKVKMAPNRHEEDYANMSDGMIP